MELSTLLHSSALLLKIQEKLLHRYQYLNISAMVFNLTNKKINTCNYDW